MSSARSKGAPFEQPASFEFTAENLDTAEAHIAKYPPGRQASAVLPLLDLAQRQSGGWLPRAAMDDVADRSDMAPIRVYEVATLLYDVQSAAGRAIPAAGLHDDAVLAARLGRVVAACERKLGIGIGETQRGRPVHADRGRMPRRLRQRADPAGQRRFLRGPGRAGDRGACSTRCARANRRRRAR